MLKILVPVDDSDASRHAVEQLPKLLDRYKEPVELHLLNIQQPLHGEVGRFLSHDQIRDFHRDNGLKALTPSRERLDAAGIAYQFHIGIGEPAEVIAEYAEDKRCDQIIMGTSARGTFSALLMGSVAMHVIQHTGVPVLLVK
jgi:nucleotide-binding universal stress UspA family protein